MKTKMPYKIKKNKKIYTIYALGFLFSIHLAFTAYINSTFLNNFTSEQFVGILYTIGSLFTILMLAVMPRILKKLGNYNVMLILSIIDIVVLLGLAFSKTIFLLAPIFIIKLMVVSVMYFNLDIFLENRTDDEETGSIRGAFITVMSIAWVVSPMIVGLLLSNGDYWKIYTISAGLVTIMTSILIYSLKDFKDPEYEYTPFFRTFMEVWRNKNIYKIFISNFILKFFYSWMVIYTPIYLHGTIGFSWSTIGMIFTVMLLPFALFEFPAGRLADTRWGEKEFLSFGFVVMSFATIALSFITDSNPVIWAALLFLTRTGASMVEIMTETYFFKQVNSTETNIIGFFRNTRPLAYIIAPIAAFIFLTFFESRYLFLGLGLIVFFGLRYSLTIKDTL